MISTVHVKQYVVFNDIIPKRSLISARYLRLNCFSDRVAYIHVWNICIHRYDWFALDSRALWYLRAQTIWRGVRILKLTRHISKSNELRGILHILQEKGRQRSQSREIVIFHGTLRVALSIGWLGRLCNAGISLNRCRKGVVINM